jgi:two-component system nitrogen regulation response regulator GlnG
LTDSLTSQSPSQSIRVLIADDDSAIRLVLRHRLEAAGYQVEETADGESALKALASGRFDVALVDIILPGMDGLEVLSRVRSNHLSTAIIVITAASTMTNAVEAMKRGAHDYLTKPFANLDLVTTAVAQAATASGNSAVSEIKVDFGGGEIIGRSPAMQEVYKLIGRVVDNDATVLIQGESGTGKELVARAIHSRSHRGREPFIAVNCAAIPQGLLESEIFGHERGSFTGATERRAGKFEQAGAGTIFLDEIGDMPLDLQPKLLRALQEREFHRIGGAETQRLQARVIAASNQNLELAVAQRRFREDLYFRLQVVPIFLPPLRERREDIPELTDYFIGKAAREMGTSVSSVSSEARALLFNHNWPGNVRELENCVMRAALLAPGNIIRADDIVFGKGAPRPVAGSDVAVDFDDLLAQRIRDFVRGTPEAELSDLYRKLVAKLERPLIEASLERAKGNQVKAAQHLGLNRNTLRKKITELGIEFRRGPSN